MAVPRWLLPLLAFLYCAMASPAAPVDPASPGAPAVEEETALWRDSLVADPMALRLAESLRPHRARAARLAHAPGKQRQQAVAQDNHQPADTTTRDPYRLPTSILPTYYKLRLIPKLSGDFKFKGQLQIDINVIEDTDKVILNAKELELAQNSVELYDASNTSISFVSSSITEDTEHEMITIDFKHTLKAKKSYYLLFNEFTGLHNNRNTGFYRSSYQVNGEKRWLVTTQFEETGARLAFPCFDEPSFKARFEISVARDPTLVAVSNMPIHSQDAVTVEGAILDTFDVTVPMSTYLVAFIVSDFKYLNDSTIFKTWGREEILSGGSFAQYIGPNSLRLEEEWTGIKFVLPKVDQFAIPDFEAGAMENWGLVTYREPYLLHTLSTTSRIKEYTATTICHELGHQWTGDLVTLDWWSHTWLNEGFATYFENYICAKILPDWNLIDKYIPANTHEGMTADANENQIAMSSPVSKPSEYGSKFDDISYQKAGAVLRMFHNVLTPEVFRAGVHRYLVINSYKNTNPTHLFTSIHEEVVKAGVALPEHTTFVEIGLSWSEQAGVPVVFATRDYNLGGLSLRQQRFFYKTPAKENSQMWWIPITMVTQSDPDWETTTADVWMSPDIRELNVGVNVASDEWLLINPHENGYYRVAYDEQNWKLLAAALVANPATFPTASRAQLLNDALNLARAGMLDYKVALDVTRFLAQDTEVTSWMTAVNTINYLRLRIDTTEVAPLFRQYLSHLTTKAFQKVGFNVGDNDEHEVLMLRYYITSWACYSNQPDCLAGATALLKRWLADSSVRLHPDIRSSALCYGVRGGGSETFNGLKAKWLTERDATLRSNYLAALGCSSDEMELQQLLFDGIRYTLNIEQTEVQSVFRAVYNRHENHMFLTDFVINNFEELNSYFGNFTIDLLANLINDVRSRSDLAKFTTYVDGNLKSWRGYERIQQALQKAEENLDWFDTYYQTVMEWFSAYASGTTSATTRLTTPGGRQTTTGGRTTDRNPATSSPTPPSSGSPSRHVCASLLVGALGLLISTVHRVI